MKYAVQFVRKFKYNDLIDEIIFDFTKFKDNLIEEVSKPIWENKRVIIDIVKCGDNEEICHILQMCKEKHKEIVIKLDDNQEKQLQKIKDAGLPYFFSTYLNAIDEMYGIIKRGVTDIYVTESLGFRLKDISYFCKKNNVKVRVIPNISQYFIGYKDEIPDPCKFFIRPEDTKIYEPYVDVFEFITARDRINAVYEVYRNEKWEGFLDSLIIGFNGHLNNAGVISAFGSNRLNCGQKCMVGKCNLCQHIFDVSKILSDNSLAIEVEKNREWKNDSEYYQKTMQDIRNKVVEEDPEVSL